MPFVRHLACLLLFVGVATGQLGAGEAPSSATAAPAATADERSPLVTESRQYLAQMTEQRNQLRQENDSLRNRQGLLLVYGALLTLLSGWLVFRALRQPGAGRGKVETDAFAAAGGTSVVVRKNATITIRNGNTQQAEVTENVQTRRAYARSETSSQIKQPVTRSVERRETAKITASNRSVVAPELDPATPIASTPVTKRHAAPTVAAADPATPAMPTTTRRHSAQAPATVRIEHQSDRLEPVEVALKPGTGTARRTATH